MNANAMISGLLCGSPFGFYKCFFQDGIMAIANAKKAAEERAKAAALKEAKRKERAAAKKEQAAVAGSGGNNDGSGTVRKNKVKLPVGPPRPAKPPHNEENIAIIEKIRSRNQNILIYDPTLQILANLQESIALDEAAIIKSKKASKANDK